jgi:hypothetical protein
MNVDFEDYLEAEVFDEQDRLIGSLDCFWTDTEDQTQFLGVKLQRSPDRTRVVPVILATPDERRSCTRIAALDQAIAGAPSLDCDEELNRKFEEKVYRHFRLSAPDGRHELQITRAQSD